MYALYQKISDTKIYGGKVRIIAVSESKETLMEMLPHEVEAWLRENSRDAKEFPDLFQHNLFKYWLPRGYEPLEHWGIEAFDSTRFEVVKVEKV